MEITINKKAMENFGKMLWDIRTAQGISQGDVQKKAGIPQPQVSGYESDKKIPSIPILIKYLDAIGCKLTITQK